MLQIIGWLGCLYLIVKCLEIASTSDFRDANGNMKGMPLAACVIGWFGAIIFALLLYAQGAGLPGSRSPDVTQGPISETPEEIMSQEKLDCIAKAKTADQMVACK